MKERLQILLDPYHIRIEKSGTKENHHMETGIAPGNACREIMALIEEYVYGQCRLAVELSKLNDGGETDVPPTVTSGATGLEACRKKIEEKIEALAASTGNSDGSY